MIVTPDIDPEEFVKSFYTEAYDVQAWFNPDYKGVKGTLNRRARRFDLGNTLELEMRLNSESTFLPISGCVLSCGLVEKTNNYRDTLTSETIVLPALTSLESRRAVLLGIQQIIADIEAASAECLKPLRNRLSPSGRVARGRLVTVFEDTMNLFRRKMESRLSDREVSEACAAGLLP